LAAFLFGPMNKWRIIFAELVNNKEIEGPELCLDHWARHRGDKYPGLEDKTKKTRSQIPIHPFALLSVLTCGFSLLGDGAGYLAQFRKNLRVAEGKRLCLCTQYDTKYGRGGYRTALVPQSTQRDDLIGGLNGDARYLLLEKCQLTGEGEWMMEVRFVI
jgi:hypothetical protein